MTRLTMTRMTMIGLTVTRPAPVAAFACLVAIALAGAASAQELQGTGRVDGGSGESLSSKLSRSDGVITPKGDIDPAMHKPAPVPHPNSTPVIPPSANGGGNAK